MICGCDFLEHDIEPHVEIAYKIIQSLWQRGYLYVYFDKDKERNPTKLFEWKITTEDNKE